MDGQQTPAGWYPDGVTSGVLRWWDGSAWTEHTSPVPAQTATPAQAPVQPSAVSASDKGVLHGLMGPRKADLAAENARLSAEVDRLSAVLTQIGGQDAAAVAAFAQRVQGELALVQAQLAQARQQLDASRAQIVATDELSVLQEVGIYKYTHPLDDAVAYKGPLASISDRQKALISGGRAVTSTTNWSVDGSTSKGMKMVKDISKLMLRAYNAEADNCVRTLKPHRLASSVERLTKVRETIAKLGASMSIRISDEYHALRVQELQLTSDYLAKTEEEKERLRAAREQEREEAKANREYVLETQRLEKEKSKYQAAIDQLMSKGDEQGAAELQDKLAQVDAALAGVTAKAANIRAGYVYVISNIGAFGEGMVKIGMTRRLEPMDRVRELGSASVPFRFDVHALIFSDDAVSLETALHHEFEAKRVNKVNPHREFYYVSPAEVRDHLVSIAGQYVTEYRDTVEALEWRASGAVIRPTAPAYDGPPLDQALTASLPDDSDGLSDDPVPSSTPW